MFLKGSSSGICFCNGNNLRTSEETNTEELSSIEKEEDNMHPRDLHEQEEDIFDDDEDDTITVQG